MENVWKIFYDRNGELLSYHASNKETRFSLRYQKGKAVFPLIENSALFCFDSKENAQKYLDRAFVDPKCFKILPVEIERFEGFIECICMKEYEVEHFWDLGGKLEKSMYWNMFLDEVPEGTVLAKSVKILEE